jgi:catechol 2,3-dioxygenase-like lactoylglutathione lyase family enzyme
MTTQGIHHITAIASDAKKTVAFFSNILGLRLVKKSVNQDDVSTYHLFFGDRFGHPGMDLTFFIFLPSSQGKLGNGQVTTISFAVQPFALQFWIERFDRLYVTHTGIEEVRDTKRVGFSDPDGMHYELVGVTEQKKETDPAIWTTHEISEEFAIRSFYSAGLSVPDRMLIEPVLVDVFGYEHMESYGNVHSYQLPSEKRASRLDVIETPISPWGVSGAGTVHHIAFRAKDTEQQYALREKVIALGLMPTDVIDRFYFRSVYFRTTGGILFEIATDAPGFTADEDEKELGMHLALPPFLEAQREEIEAHLVPLP